MRKRESTIGIRRRERGSQLLELALMLPLLLALTAGVVAFAQAWNVRQILANAARDGARLGASQASLSLVGSGSPPPESIQEICQQVADYLISEHIDTSFMGISGATSSDVTSGCSSAGVVMGTVSGSSPVPVAFVYPSSGTSGFTYGLEIEPSVKVPAGCGTLVTCIGSTRVTLGYPYNWTFGFNHVIKLLGVSNYPATFAITVYATSANLAN
jgi:hypothetical protein